MPAAEPLYFHIASGPDTSWLSWDFHDSLVMPDWTGRVRVFPCILAYYLSRRFDSDEMTETLMRQKDGRAMRWWIGEEGQAKLTQVTGRVPRTNEYFNERQVEYVERAVSYRFNNNVALAELLMKTDGLELIYATPYDNYWGYDRDLRKGDNKLGEIIMAKRTRLLRGRK